MSYQLIQTLFNEKVAEIVGLPTLQLENTLNVGKAGVPFSRLTLLPARTQQLTVGLHGSNKALGLAQIDLFYPLNTGTDAVNAMADAVLAEFPRGTSLADQGVSVYVQTAWREVGRRVEQFYQVPVMVQWTSIVPGQ